VFLKCQLHVFVSICFILGLLVLHIVDIALFVAVMLIVMMIMMIIMMMFDGNIVSERL